jgi:hypothetical protein
VPESGDWQNLGDVGETLLRLTQPGNWYRWLLRRVDSISFPEYHAARRRVEVHVDLDGLGEARESLTVENVLLLPLGRLDREVHTSVLLLDESGALVPRLTRNEERALVLAGLQRAASQALRAPLDESTLEVITRVATADLGRRPRSSYSGVPLPWDHGPEVLRYSIPETQRARLAANDGFRLLLNQVHETYFFIAPLDAASSPRRVLRYEYTEDPQFVHPSEYRRRLAELFMPQPGVDFSCPAQMAGECDSYHFEVSAPYDLVLCDGGLLTRVEDEAGDESYYLTTDDDASRTSSHIYASFEEVVLSGEFVATLRPYGGGGLVRSAAITSLLPLVFLLGGLTAAALHLDHRGWTTDVDPSSSTATILLVPGILPALLASRSRHSLTTKLTFGTRVTMLLSALLLVPAATSVALGFRRAPFILLWSLLAAGGFLASFRLFAQFFYLRDA